MSNEKAISQMRSMASSALFWIAEHQKHKDIPSYRHAYAGVYAFLQASQIFKLFVEDIPQDLVDSSKTIAQWFEMEH